MTGWCGLISETQFQVSQRTEVRHKDQKEYCGGLSFTTDGRYLLECGRNGRDVVPIKKDMPKDGQGGKAHLLVWDARQSDKRGTFTK